MLETCCVVYCWTCFKLFEFDSVSLASCTFAGQHVWKEVIQIMLQKLRFSVSARTTYWRLCWTCCLREHTEPWSDPVFDSLQLWCQQWLASWVPVLNDVDSCKPYMYQFITFGARTQCFLILCFLMCKLWTVFGIVFGICIQHGYWLCYMVICSSTHIVSLPYSAVIYIVYIGVNSDQVVIMIFHFCLCCTLVVAGT